MAIAVLAVVALGGVCRPSYVRSCGGWRSNLIEKEMARKMDATRDFIPVCAAADSLCCGER